MKQEQQERIAFMRAVAKEVSEHEPAVLKGGTALLLTRCLDRFSEDMDFDLPPGNHSDLRPCIYRAAQKTGLQIQDINIKKDTDTTRRYMVHYASAFSAQDYPLKIECSMRNEIDPCDVENVDGIRTYTVARLAELKSEAFMNRDKARDTYDLAFLMERYPSQIRSSTLEKVKQHLQGRGIDDLCDSFDREKQTDPLLSEFDGADIVLRLQESVQFHDLPNMAEVQAAESKASLVHSLDKSADGMSAVEGKDIGYIEEGYVAAANEVKYEAQEARTANIEAQALKVGQRVTFQAKDRGSSVKLTGTVEQVDPTTVTLKCGSMSIPVVKESGSFSLASSVSKEHTREFAKERALQGLGAGGKVLLARHKGTYSGKIIGKTSTFAIQKINDNTAVLHRLKDLESKEKDAQGLIKEGEELTIVREGTTVSLSRLEPGARDNDKVRTQQKTRGGLSR